MFKPRTYLLAGAALAAVLTLSACTNGTEPSSSSGSSSAPTASASFASADVTFAQMMIPHHEQAVEMSEDILAKGEVDVRIADLATQIKAAQEPEIEQLRDWLTEWGADETSTGGMDGMMSDDDMMALENASGPQAGELYLEQMIVHHQGAIMMAELELDEGQNEDAKAMASNIVTSQTDEIDVMKDILSSL